MRKKVLVIGSSLNDKGGIVTVMKNIKESNLNKEFEFIHIDTYNTCNNLERLKIYIVGIIKTIVKIFSGKIDVVHIHMSYKGSFYRKSIIILLVKLLGKPIVLHMHGSCFKEFYNGLGTLQKKYCSYIFNKVDKLIVLSKSWKEFFELIIPEDKIEVVNNSIPINNLQINIKKQLKEEVVFIFMGRLGQRKGIYDLLNVAEQISLDDKYKNRFKLIIAGDGEIDKVSDIIRQKNIQDIVINKGWIDGDDKEKLLKEGDVFVLPSYNEGLPMAILEAMSYHLVCISTNVGGIPEVISHGLNGYIHKPGDTFQLFEYIKNTIDDNYNRTKMSEKSFERVYKNFNQEKELCKIKKIYMNILE